MRVVFRAAGSDRESSSPMSLLPVQPRWRPAGKRPRVLIADVAAASAATLASRCWQATRALSADVVSMKSQDQARELCVVAVSRRERLRADRADLVVGKVNVLYGREACPVSPTISSVRSSSGLELHYRFAKQPPSRPFSPAHLGPARRPLGCRGRSPSGAAAPAGRSDFVGRGWAAARVTRWRAESSWAID
jgi:hypothetical protein